MPNPGPGTILGAYLVEGTIGSGSMGEVFRGIDTGLNRKVAIKILSEKHRDSNELRARFVREGRAVAAISHPNVVQVFATGNYDERPYIAMELLDGIDLGSEIEKHGPLDSMSAAHAVLDAAQGLAAAAKAGLIHRDVKPSNLVRLTDGRVKVTDFGLAKPVDPGHEPALTAMGVVVGTPDYIAPEQARGDAIDERVDIYALGGTLYFLLTGVPPFRTGKPAEDKYLKVVARHLRNPPPDATEKRPDVDRELADLTRTLMAKRADERPSYSDLIEQLSLILSRLDPDAIPELINRSRDRSRPFKLPTDPRGASPPSRNSGPISAPPGVLVPATIPPANAGPAAVSRAPGASLRDDGATVSDGSLVMPPRGFPLWLAMLTVAAVGVFIVGLVVRLDSGPRAPASGSTTPSNGASNLGGAAHPVAPTPGILLKHPDGKPWVQVDAHPVTVAAYRQLIAKHQQDGGAQDDDWVVNLSYDEARAYAKAVGGRLPLSVEWDALSNAQGVVVDPALVEWVESPDAKKQVNARGRHDNRPDKPQPDVTFRVARDP